MFFTVMYLLLAVLSNWLRHSTITSHFKRVKIVMRRNSISLSSSTLPEGVCTTGEERGGGDDSDEGDESLRDESGPCTSSQRSKVSFETREIDENGHVMSRTVENPVSFDAGRLG